MMVSQTKLAGLALAFALGLSGCVGGGYTQQHVGQIEQVYVGQVTVARFIDIQDDGGGALLGAAIGAGLGHAAGVKGKTQTETTLGGAALGALAGSQINRDSGQELTILLGDGREIVTVQKLDPRQPISFRAGDRVKVYMTGGRVSRVLLY